MKHLLFIFAMTFSVVGLQAQELLLPCAPNDVAPLSYTFKVVSADRPDQARHLEAQIAKLLGKFQPSIEPNLYGAEFSDVTIELLEPNKVKMGDKIVQVKSVAQLARRISTEVVRVLALDEGTLSYSVPFSVDSTGYVEYRIPSVVTASNGRVVVFCEARSLHSDQGYNDIVTRYSDDGGATWSKMVVIDDKGKASLNNPCVVYLPGLQRILLMYNYYPADVTEASAGHGEHSMQKTYITYSDDNGQTWASPRDISVQVMHPLAKSYCSGPGAAILLTRGPNKGRIVAPFNGNGSSRWFNYLVYSDDNGDSWHIYKGLSSYGTNESQIVQLSDTTLLFNARSHRNIGDTSYLAPSGWNPWNMSAVTRNRANVNITMIGDSVSWGVPQIMENQPDPTCQGSIIRLKNGMVVLSNPASQHTFTTEGRPYSQTPPMRINGTVKVSTDGGKTWIAQKRIYGNRFTEFQYSVLTDMGKGSVGCLFETHPNISFTRIPLTWVLGRRGR